MPPAPSFSARQRLAWALALVLAGLVAWRSWHLAGGGKPSPTLSEPPAPIMAQAHPTASTLSPAPEEQAINVRLNRWLLSSSDLDKVAENITNAFHTVKPEDQPAVVRELIALVPNARYPRLGRILLDPKTHPKALTMIFRNLGYRPDYIELPMNLELMRMAERHPLSEDARIKLSVRFGEDYGNDWNKWQTRIAKELKTR